MKTFNNIFLRKKILIYGLGKSGISSYKFLKNKSDVYLFDDNQKIKLKLKEKFIKLIHMQTKRILEFGLKEKKLLLLALGFLDG